MSFKSLRTLRDAVIVALGLFIPSVMIGASTMSCRTMHAASVPAAVLTTIDLRVGVLTQAETDLAADHLSNDALLQLLGDDLRAWSYLRVKSSGWSAPEDFTAAMQLQVVGLEVAIEKIHAGEYDHAQALALLAALHKAWSACGSYFNLE